MHNPFELTRTLETVGNQVQDSNTKAWEAPEAPRFHPRRRGTLRQFRSCARVLSKDLRSTCNDTLFLGHMLSIGSELAVDSDGTLRLSQFLP